MSAVHECPPLGGSRREPTPFWDLNFAELEAYATSNQHCRVPYRIGERINPLYRWTARQRRSRFRLSARQRALLERLPGWHWDLRDADWARGFTALQAFAAREGHARVPRRHIEDDFHLGAWVCGQRLRRATMPLSHQRRLESVPRWAWDARDASWNTRFALLKAYSESAGTSRVPHGKVINGEHLGAWVSRQRRAHHADRLPAQYELLLQSLPDWTWGTSRSTKAR